MMIPSLLREPFISKGGGDDESIYDFTARRLGKRIANTLIDPIALGIFAGDIRKLSVQSCFPILTQWERERGSIVFGALLSRFKKKRGPAGLFTLQGGMKTLIGELALKSQAKIRLDTPALEIRSDGVQASDAFYPADLIVSALSGSSIGRLTGLWCDFAEADISLVHLAFEGDVLPKKGFGYLVPTWVKENLLGMVFDSAVFPQQSSSKETRVTLMMRRAPDLEEALDVMRRHLGVSQRPIFSSVHLAKGAIPEFHVGYGKRLGEFEKEAKKKFPSLILLGNYLRGASVDACIALAKQSL
jgi:protoporphyrinogen/coproporphyrinogen III oxidase